MRSVSGAPAHSSRRLRSTILPPSKYTRGTRLLTAQARPHRALRGGDPPSHFGRPGRARPPQGFAASAAKRLYAASAAARCPALTAAAGCAPRLSHPPGTPAAPACSPRRSGPTAPCAAGSPPSHLGRPGRARPPQGFAASAVKRLYAASAAARCPALTAAAGCAPRLSHPPGTPAAPACSPRRSARRGWWPEGLPARPPSACPRRSPPRLPP